MTTPTDAHTIGDAVAEHLVALARQQRDGEASPACLLIPDPDSVWALAAPTLIELGVPLLLLGEHSPESRTGSAAWIRTMIDTDSEQDAWVVVLPGVHPSQLESSSATPQTKLLVDLRFRGTLLVTANKQHIRFDDFLRDPQAGLGLDVRDDLQTREAIQSGIKPLLARPLDDFTNRSFGATKIRELAVKNPVAKLLDWISAPADIQKRYEAADEWDSFVALCKQTYEFDPVTDGELIAATKLAQGARDWSQVWDSFCDKAAKLPGVVAALEQVQPHPDIKLYALPNENRRLEHELAESLGELKDAAAAEACAQVSALEAEHGKRREWVWRELKKSPLADALKHLAYVADAPKPAGDIDSWWTAEGWRIDDAALRALAACRGDDDRACVIAALRAIYLSWLDDTARRLQQFIDKDGTLGTLPATIGAEPGTCIVFVDGLRGDLAHRLVNLLGDAVSTTLDWRFAPLPSITTNGKPAVVPTKLDLSPAAKFDLTFTGGGKVDAASIRKKLEADGWTIVDPFNPESTMGLDRGWCELVKASIDDLGHDAGDRFAESVPAQLRDIAEAIHRLIKVGWSKIRIVTDHGFLFLPGGLPKAEIAQHLTKARKPRCARLVDGAPGQPIERPWAWARDERVAFPPGASVYEGNSSYEHGGISLQECIVPTIVITGNVHSRPEDTTVSVAWKGYRCYVSAPGLSAASGNDVVRVDIRRRPKDASSTVAVKPVQLDEDGDAKLTFDDDSLGTQQAEELDLWLVFESANGTLLAQQQTKVGEA